MSSQAKTRQSGRALAWQDLQYDYRNLIGAKTVKNEVKRTSLDKAKKVYFNPVSTTPGGEYS